MKLNKIEEAAFEAAEKMLMENGIDEDTGYVFGYTEEFKHKKLASRTLNLTFPFEKDQVEALKVHGWKVEKKYANHGSPDFYCSDLHNDESELQELICHHGKRVEMVRMVIEKRF